MPNFKPIELIDNVFASIHSRILDFCCNLTGKTNFWVARCALSVATGAGAVAIALWVMSLMEQESIESANVAGTMGCCVVATSPVVLRWIRVLEATAKRYKGGAKALHIDQRFILLRVGVEILGLTCGLMLVTTSNLVAWYSLAALALIATGLAALLYFVEMSHGGGKSVVKRGLERFQRQRMQRARSVPHPMPT